MDDPIEQLICHEVRTNDDYDQSKITSRIGMSTQSIEKSLIKSEIVDCKKLNFENSIKFIFDNLLSTGLNELTFIKDQFKMKQRNIGLTINKIVLNGDYIGNEIVKTTKESLESKFDITLTINTQFDLQDAAGGLDISYYSGVDLVSANITEEALDNKISNDIIFLLGTLNDS